MSMKKSLTYWDPMPCYHGTDVNKLLHWLLPFKRWSNCSFSQKSMTVDSIETHKKNVFFFFVCCCNRTFVLLPRGFSLGFSWCLLEEAESKRTQMRFFCLEYLWRFVLFRRKRLTVASSKALGVQGTDHKQYHCGDTGKKANSLF